MQNLGRYGLEDVTVRPIKGQEELTRWRELMRKHHPLGLQDSYGPTLKQVAELPDGRWVALLGWSGGAFKTAARDRRVGWTKEQQFRRLHLVANNSRYLVLPDFEVPNLASRVLGLSVRRLSGDMERLRGHPVLLAETFVDPSSQRGTCYLAAGWEQVGFTKGFARKADGWEEHGQPKMLFLKTLPGCDASALSGADEPEEWHCGPPSKAPSLGRLRSLFDFLGSVPDFRRAQGRKHRLRTILAIAIAGKLAGVPGITALAEFAGRLTQAQLKAVRSYRNPKTGELEPPSQTTMHRVLANLDPDDLDRAVRDWAATQGVAGDPVALDGKGSPERVQGPKDDRMLIAAMEHGSGLVLGQTASESAGGEIEGVRRLLSEIDVRGRVVTLDALHSCRKTAAHILEQGADYLITVKGNRKTLVQDIKDLDWSSAAEYETVDKDHGRINTRRCRVITLDCPEVDCADLPGRCQVFRIERERHVLKTGKTTVEKAYGITSLPPESADAETILTISRAHWGIENRVHYVRDVAYDEDRCRTRVKHMRRNLACLTSAAISIIRVQGKFNEIPQANRHYAAKQREAVAAVFSKT